MNFETQYKNILRETFSGVKREDRTGVGCLSIFAKHIEVDLQHELPIVQSRKIYPFIARSEFNWFMQGEHTTDRFRRDGVKIWDSWANEDGDLGPVYGYQARNWNGEGIDQIEGVIDSLTNNPHSRRHIISLWNVSQLGEMALPPCYHNMQFFADKNGFLNLHVLQRSADMFLGVPYDMLLFSNILTYIAHETCMAPRKIHVTFVDAHVYMNQFDAVEEYLKQPSHPECVDWKFSYDEERKGGMGIVATTPDAKNITAAVAV